MTAVGMRVHHYDDRQRLNWDGTAPRPLAVTLWYPATEGAKSVFLDVGPERAPFFRMGEVALDAAIASASRPYPVIVFSHGTGGSAQSSGWFGVGLAARGYVVIGVEHHGNSANEAYRAEGFAAGWERAGDLTAALDCVLSDPSYADLIDGHNIFAAGFSLGGHAVASLLGARLDRSSYRRNLPTTRGPDGTATRVFPDFVDRIDEIVAANPVFRASYERMEASYHDPRIRAGLALAPAPSILSFTEDSLGRIATPLLIYVGDADLVAPRETCARWLHARVPGSEIVERLGGVGHNVFLCEGLKTGKRFDPGLFEDPEGVNRGDIHRDVAARADVFFKANMV